MAHACRAGAVAIAALAAVSPATGTQFASRIVDRTLICPMVGVGYPESIRVLYASASPFDAAYEYAARASIRNGGGGGASVSAGVQTGPGPGHTGLAWLNRSGCRTTKIRVPLSARGLKPGAAERAEYACDVPARVLIRVRAVFERPTAFTVDPRSPQYTYARGDVATGYVAVAALRGRKPIFFASVHDATGKARIFVTPSRCARRPG